MPKEGWAIPLGITTKKHHYFRKGRTLCGKYYGYPSQVFDDVREKERCALCNRRYKYGYLEIIPKLLKSRKFTKLVKVFGKYGDHRQYSLQQHYQHLLEEVEELKKAIETGEPEKILEELIDISNMCDLTFHKMKSLGLIK